MKTSTFLFLAVAGLASAQLQALPTCAQSCANIFLAGGIGNCGTNPRCICSQQDFITKMSCCLIGACSTDDQKNALTFAHQLCEANGVKDLPNVISCPSGTPSTPGIPSTPGTSPVSSAPYPAPTPTVPGNGSGSTPVAPGHPATTSAPPNSTSNAGKEMAHGLAALGGLVAAVALL